MISKRLFNEADLFIYLAEGLARGEGGALCAVGINALEVGFVRDDALGLLTDGAQRLDNGVAYRGFA